MDIFNIHLPVAGIEFNVLLLILIGFCVGVIGGFFGVGGGWIITPALNIFGFHMAFAIGTGLSNIFGQSFGAINKHQKMGNIDWKLGSISIISSILGFEIGSQIVITLEKAGDVGLIIRWCYVIFLASLGMFMFYDYFVLHPRQLKRIEKELKTTAAAELDSNHSGIVRSLHNITIPPMISLPISKIEAVSLWIILLVFLFTGFLSGLLGIGGGFIIMPALVYLIGLPTIVAVGTSLITVFFISAYGCFMYALDGRVELIAACFMLIGASIGAQIGATAVKYIKGYGIRLLFAIMIIFTGFSVVSEQVYKITMNHFFQTLAGIILIGTAITMVIIIIEKLVVERNKERKIYLKPTI